MIQALVLAAGKGMRMNSDVPKVLHPLNNKCLIDYCITSLQQAGCGDICVVVGYQADRVKQHLTGYSGLSYALQDKQLGTGHAVLCAQQHVKYHEGTLIIMPGDVPLVEPATYKRLIDFHQQHGKHLSVVTTQVDNPFGYGRCKRDEHGQLCAIVEEKNASHQERAIREINTGIYAVTLPWLWQTLPKISKDNVSGEYYLTDLVGLAVDDLNVAALCIEASHQFHGVNTTQQLEQLECEGS